jgi:hypothetical protein
LRCAMASRLSIGRRRWRWRCNRERKWKRKRERGCADGASRLALRRADADNARMTLQRRRWLSGMIRSTSPRLSRSLNPPLAIRYRSSALGARQSALQTGLLPGLESACPSPHLKLLSSSSFPRLGMSRAPLSPWLCSHFLPQLQASG